MKTIVTTLFIFMVIVFSGCSLLRKSADKLVAIVEHTEVKAPPKEAPGAYKEAMGDLEDSKFQPAFDKFDAFVKDQPASPYTQAAILNSGRALEGLGRWSDAAEKYRAVVRGTGNARKLQAMALYRLSFCEEALGDDQQVVAVLSDLLKRADELPKEMARAELPARLATAYARVGNFDRALDFYRQAESGIAKLRQESGDEVPEWLPRTLFFMGELSRRAPNWSDFETSLRPLARGQIYLLQAAELAAQPWADKAAGELIGTYNALWNAIISAPLPNDGEPLLAKRALQQKQWNRAILLLDSIAELRARILPKDSSAHGEASQKIAGEMDDLEGKIQKMLLERPAGEGLTREAIQRRGQLRGRVVDPNGSLEQRFIEQSREVPKLKKLKKDPPKAKILPPKKKSEPAVTAKETERVVATPTPTPAPLVEPGSSPTPPLEDPNL